jgi:hypothetical protein
MPDDKVNIWDIPSQQQSATPAQSKLALISSEGLWYPRIPLYDSACFVDISTLGTDFNSATEIFPAVPGVAYIIGPPTIVIDNPTAYALVGFTGWLFGTVLDPTGTKASTQAVLGIGGGWSPTEIRMLTQPGNNITACIASVKPAAGVAFLVIPVMRVQEVPV